MLFDAHFIERKNRFVGTAQYEGQVVEAYIPNTGRLKELLIANTRVKLRRISSKLGWKLVGVKKGNVWVSVDAIGVNSYFEKWLSEAKIFSGYTVIKREVKVGNSRIDFLLSDGNERFFVEVKSCTLVEDGTAFFPDAPTARGVRHIDELIRLKMAGQRVGVVFIIQREDGESFQPNNNMHPAFAAKLIQAWRNGVEIYYIRSKYDVKRDELLFLELKAWTPK